MIEAILIASLFCSGLYILGDMILSPVKDFLCELFTYKHKQLLIWKPLWGCPPCMASIWGSLVWWAYHWRFDTPFWDWFCFWPIAVIGIAFMNYLLVHFAKFYDRP